MTFQNGVEYKITIDGEIWSPGDTLSGTLESKTPVALNLFLADGIDKKVKAKDPKAFTILQPLTAATSPYAWKIPLPLDARVSDTKGSLYVLYGSGENPEKLGQLRLNIQPHLHLRDLSDLLTAHFRFAQKGTSAGKNGMTEIKFGPPLSRDWASLEQLVVQAKMTAKTIEINFQFERNEIDPAKGGLASKSVKRDFARSWELAKMVHDFNQRLNKEIATAAVENVIEEYRSAGWI